ncbi:MAG: penicillin-binding protein [Bacilli bacterium]|nr:penicillin-binding protein [Bacilli bacterium]
MAKKKNNTKKVKTNYLFVIGVLFLFVLFIYRLSYLCLVDYKVGNETITAFIRNRNTEEETILPDRGTIYDTNSNVLAEDVASYMVIAYLNPSRSENSKKPLHVVDVNATAEKLAPYINLDVSVLKTLLSKKVYQTELGPGARNLSQIQMEAIKNLNLPGIDFVASTKRYYPNGDFASYAIGYTVNSKDKNGTEWKKGQLGIEEYFDDTLKGDSGYVRYEKDRNGYKIANGREYKEDADDGDDIYLTIDDGIEMFTESAIKKMEADSGAEWSLMIVADAKTGAILAYSTSPSFDPNKRDMVSYIDPLTGYIYEPGSTMKIFSYMCAVEKGNYNGNNTFDSGYIKFVASDGTETVIHDWNKVGWGKITFDKGFALSSNVGASKLLDSQMINKKDLSNCYDKYGFGKVVDFTLNREESGSVKFNYDIDAASATFGQGITVTPIQMIQAMTAITNNGEILKPYMVKKIVDTDTGEVSYEATKEVIEQVASKKTVDKIKDLMASVVCEDSKECTGSAYYMKDNLVIGKTGTAQIYNEKTGTYMKGASDYVYSFAGIYPKDDPEIIIYSALKRPKDTNNYIAPAIKDVVVNVSKYLNIITSHSEVTTYKIDNYLNKDVSNVSSDIIKNGMKLYVLGNGKKVIRQYPSKNTNLYSGSVVVLLTDTYDKKIPNLIGLSYKDASNILKLMGVKYKINGKGYVVSQSIAEGNVVADNMEVVLSMNN